MIDKLKGAWQILWTGLRWPYRERTAWINVSAWVFAFALVVISAVADIITGQWWWLLWMAVVGTFDIVMLRRSIAGLLWRRARDKRLKAKASGEPGAHLS